VGEGPLGGSFVQFVPHHFLDEEIHGLIVQLRC
jgi:hypothetical protein